MSKTKKIRLLNSFRGKASWKFIALLIIFMSLFSGAKSFANQLSALGLHVIPYPQQVQLGGEDFIFSDELTIVLDQNASEADKFAAEELASDLKNEWNIHAKISNTKGGQSIIMTRRQAPKTLKEQGYQIAIVTNANPKQKKLATAEFTIYL